MRGMNHIAPFGEGWTVGQRQADPGAPKCVGNGGRPFGPEHVVQHIEPLTLALELVRREVALADRGSTHPLTGPAEDFGEQHGGGETIRLWTPDTGRAGAMRVPVGAGRQLFRSR